MQDSSDIKVKKQNNNKFIVNDNSRFNDEEFEIRKNELPENELPEEDDFNDYDMIKDRLYNSEEEEEEDEEQSEGGNSSYSYIDEDSEDIRKQKSFLLFKLKRLEEKGYPPVKLFTMDDPLVKIKSEVERINKEIEVKRGVEFSRQGLLFFTNGIEMMNNKFDPLDLQLDGWSESVAANIDSYDDVFEELYEKYHTKVSVAPEVKLIMMILGSAFMFHFSKTFAKKSENIQNIFNNPDVMASVGKAMAEEARKQPQQPQQQQPASQRKMKGPDSNIDDLLAKLEVESENGDEDEKIKSIPMNPQTKKRGRPKKTDVQEDETSKIMLDI
jgi:hypothetical protein